MSSIIHHKGNQFYKSDKVLAIKVKIRYEMVDDLEITDRVQIFFSEILNIFCKVPRDLHPPAALHQPAHPQLPALQRHEAGE